MGLPTPEAALGLWMSWMKQNMGGFAPTGSTEQPWWVASADAVSGSLLATGVEQFQRFVAADPMLGSIDRVERQPAARGDPGRLGGSRARPAHRLAASPRRPRSRA